jgi:HSP20 family protein
MTTSAAALASRDWHTGCNWFLARGAAAVRGAGSTITHHHERIAHTEDAAMLYANLPAPPLFGLRRDIDRLFDETFNRDAGSRMGWLPATDVREDDKAVTLEVELAGIAPENVQVTAENGVLTVKGERNGAEAVRNQNERWHLTERLHGKFERSFQLHGNLNESGIDASFSNGLLTVRVPKAALPEPKKIEIKTR